VESEALDDGQPLVDGVKDGLQDAYSELGEGGEEINDQAPSES